MTSYRDPLKAGLLSVAVPGAGHVYAGEPARGFTYFLGVAVGLFLFIAPGVVIWLAAIADAALMARQHNARLAPLYLPAERPPLSFMPVSISDGAAPAPALHDDPAPRHLPRPTAP